MESHSACYRFGFDHSPDFLGGISIHPLCLYLFLLLRSAMPLLEYACCLPLFFVMVCLDCFNLKLGEGCCDCFYRLLFVVWFSILATFRDRIV